MREPAAGALKRRGRKGLAATAFVTLATQPIDDSRGTMIRVILPPHLRTLAHVGMEVRIDVQGAITQRSVLDALEASYPMLCGTIRDHDTKERRPFLRFFVCGEDWSHESPDHPLPQPIAQGKEPFLVIGAIAGG